MGQERGKLLMEQAIDAQYFHDMLVYKMQVDMQRKLQEFIIMGETTYKSGNPVDPLNGIFEAAPVMDSPASAQDKVQAFEQRLELGVFVKNVAVTDTEGTYFEYRPDKANFTEPPEIRYGSSNYWQWANTANSASMKRCHETCTGERWSAIMKALNHITS